MRRRRAAIALGAGGLALVVAKSCALLAVPVAGPLELLAALLQDVAVAGVLALGAALLPAVAGAAALLLLVAFTAVSAGTVATVGTPLAAPMLAGADAAMTDSLRASLHWRSLGPMLAVVAGAAVGVCAGRRWHPGRRSAVALAFLCALACWFGGAEQPAHRTAVWHFVRSALPRAVAGTGAAALALRPVTAAPTEPGVAALRSAAAGRSVVLVVLESAAAGHLRPWGGEADPMPFVTGLAAHSLVCRTTWAVYPESIKGLRALLAAVPPRPDSPPAEYRTGTGASLPQRLAAAGYDTALFHPGHFEFLGMEHVLAGLAFGTARDADDFGAAATRSFGVDEEVAVAAALEHVRSLPDERRFLLAYLPVAGHHPYDSPPGGPFPTDSQQGCYHNALHYADGNVRALWDGLCRLRPRESMLLCVVGDHGEAFGEHAGNFGHTFALYEENLRVPLLFHVPGRTEVPAVVERVQSQLDVVPTLLDLLGLPPCPEHGGASMLQPGRRPALAFTDWGDLLFAGRDGDSKFLWEVQGGREWWFDLGRDPGERTELSRRDGDAVAAWRSLLRRWRAGLGVPPTASR